MEYWNTILIEVFKLFFFVIGGTILGSIFEYNGWTKYVSVLIKPILKFGRLPSICGTSLVTAIFSNSAASAILAGAKNDNHINRREMIVTGSISAFPTHICHLTKSLFIIFPLLGPTAVFYYIIVFINDLAGSLILLLYNRIKCKANISSYNELNLKTKILQPGEIYSKTLKRVKKIIIRLIVIFLPLYLCSIYLIHTGLLNNVNYYIPSFLNTFLNHKIISIAISKIGGLTSSATVANALLVNSEILPIQILLGFLIANIIAIPFNTLRRNLPTAVAVYPAKDGIWIVLITESIRFIFNLFSIIFILFLFE